MRGIQLVHLILIILMPSILQASSKPLPWPVSLDQYPYQFGANTSQFVRFDTTYFHAGQDIVAPAGKPVFATVSGRIEGGYYSYEDFKTGHSKKNFIPLSEAMGLDEPPLWGKNYFEIAIIDNTGKRFEYHHIDFESLPGSILDLILNGGDVKAGEIVGFVVARNIIQFGIEYDHIHYNVIDSKGIYLNPFSVSEEIEDTTAPVLKPSFFHKKNDKARCSIHPGPFLRTTQESEVNEDVDYVVFEAFDIISNNKIPQALTKIEYVYTSLLKTVTYDFSSHLKVDADIREIYFREFCIGDVSFPVNLKGSTNTKFYYKAPVPISYKGELVINAFDFSGNKTTKKIMINND